VEKIGLQGLYARHIHHLNELAKKHHRSLMIWTSHELFNKPDDFTRFASVPADKDLSIMEWIYTTPASYPTLSGYQNLGFAHLFVAPATLNYGYPYPDYELGLRTIQGLIRAGIQNGAIGGCDTTWQMEQGSQLETHWYGFLYTAQC
jgi:hypothetical protein